MNTNTLPTVLKKIIEDNDDFQSEICSVYKTQSGKNALIIKIHRNARFSYSGEYGAGSGHDFETMKKNVQFMMTYHKKTRLVDGFDFLNGEA